MVADRASELEIVCVSLPLVFMSKTLKGGWCFSCQSCLDKMPGWRLETVHLFTLRKPAMSLLSQAFVLLGGWSGFLGSQQMNCFPEVWGSFMSWVNWWGRSWRERGVLRLWGSGSHKEWPARVST